VATASLQAAPLHRAIGRFSRPITTQLPFPCAGSWRLPHSIRRIPRSPLAGGQPVPVPRLPFVGLVKTPPFQAVFHVPPPPRGPFRPGLPLRFIDDWLINFSGFRSSCFHPSYPRFFGRFSPPKSLRTSGTFCLDFDTNRPPEASSSGWLFAPRRLFFTV